MPVIDVLTGLEILDSRGRPTVQAACRLASGAMGKASVPSGASTGKAEAVELRDGDLMRYGGLGCRQAAAHVRDDLHRALAGRDWDQAGLDARMQEEDGTPDKSRLGANALLAVSIAFARAVALERGLPLFRYFAGVIPGFDGEPAGYRMPRLTVNLFSGGKHAGGQVPIQDVLLVPLAAASVDESLAAVYAVYQAAAALVQRKYGIRLLRADEGGLAPPCTTVEEMLEDAVEAISAAGLNPGTDMALAVDVASSHFWHEGRYCWGDESLDSLDMIARLSSWVDQYPIVSLEDGLAEEDWMHWPVLLEKLGGRVLILGDDLLCTNPQRICRAIDTRAANALLLKVNQVGTLTEAARACSMARSAEWSVTVSARSGETEDYWLADLAVGWAGNQIKIGSITQSDRLAKYNRLLEIEAVEGFPLAPWPGRSSSTDQS